MVSLYHQITDHFSRSGTCVSYDRILKLAQNIYKNLRESYNNHNLLFPKILKKSIFTIMMKDSIVMTARSTLVKSLSHGTGLLIIHFRTNENAGVSVKNVCRVSKARKIPRNFRLCQLNM